MFDDNIEVLDFAAEPEKCRSQINTFVEEVTKNNIKDFLPQGSINTDTNVILANAAYFKGNWLSKFDKEETQKKIFYEHSRMPVYVDMMKQRGNFNYGIEFAKRVKLNETNFCDCFELVCRCYRTIEHSVFGNAVQG